MRTYRTRTGTVGYFPYVRQLREELVGCVHNAERRIEWIQHQAISNRELPVKAGDWLVLRCPHDCEPIVVVLE